MKYRYFLTYIITRYINRSLCKNIESIDKFIKMIINLSGDIDSDKISLVSLIQ